MTHLLYLADPAYSSWSMRAGLIVDRFGIDVDLRWVEIYGDPPLARQLGHPPARTVPLLVCDDGAVVRDSLAIAEELASRNADLPLWPRESSLRALARSLCAEMHAGFGALRSHCPMNLRTAYADVPVPDAVAADLDRIATIFADALDRAGGPWLAGDWSIADAFFAPVAARIAGHGLAVPTHVQTYVDLHLADPGFRRWRAFGLERGEALSESHYKKPWRRVEWPA